MSKKPDTDEVKEAVRDKVEGFDEDEWGTHINNYQDHFGDMANDGFIAWAVALSEYDVHIESDYDLPGGGGGSSGQQEDPEAYSLSDLSEVDHEDNEQIIVEGLVSNYRKDTSSKGNPQLKFRLQDDTGRTTAICTGERNVENLAEANISDGDYIRITSAQVFHPEPDEGDDPFYGVTLPYWADIEILEDKGWEDIAKDFIEDITNEGDYVFLEGIITSENFREYTGCSECMKKVDPEEDRVCKSCGHDEFTTYEPGEIKVTHGDKNVDVSIPPYIEFTESEPVFKKVKVLGTWSKREYDGTDYWEINADRYEIQNDDDDDGPSLPSNPTTVSNDDEDDSEGDTVDEETEDVSDSEEDEQEETESSDTSDDSDTNKTNGTSVEDIEAPEGIDEVKEKVEGFGVEMPAKAGVVVLRDKVGIEDEDEVAAAIEYLQKDPEVDVIEDEGSVADREWNEVMLKWAA